MRSQRGFLAGSRFVGEETAGARMAVLQIYRAGHLPCDVRVVGLGKRRRGIHRGCEISALRATSCAKRRTSVYEQTMNSPAGRLLVLGGFLFAGCDTMHNVAVSSFRVFDAPANYIRQHLDNEPAQTTTTTTTRTV